MFYEYIFWKQNWEAWNDQTWYYCRIIIITQSREMGVFILNNFEEKVSRILLWLCSECRTINRIGSPSIAPNTFSRNAFSRDEKIHIFPRNYFPKKLFPEEIISLEIIFNTFFRNEFSIHKIHAKFIEFTQNFYFPR